MITDLTNNEIIFIEIQRIFHYFFMRNLYFVRQYSYNDRDGDSLTFVNDRVKQEILFKWVNGFEISIIQKSLFQNSNQVNEKNIIQLTIIKKYFNDFKGLPENLPINESLNILKKISIFIQIELMPIIKGEMWIDELLKSKEISNAD